MKRPTLIVLSISIGLWSVVPGVSAEEALSWMETAKLLAADGTNDDLFGDSVAISGDTIVAGACNEGPNLEGAAYVFEFDADSGGWVETGKLRASDGHEAELFGESVAVAADTVVVGAASHRHSGGNSSGAAYVFEPDADGVWVETAELLAPSGELGTAFGDSVAISGDTIVVGASTHGFNSGAAYVFEREAPGGGWSPVAELLPPDLTSGMRFGASAAIEEDTLVVGADSDPYGVGAGGDNSAAYVFERAPDTETWTLAAKLEPFEDPEEENFGSDVAISGDTIAVSRKWDSVFVFERNPDGLWRNGARVFPGAMGEATSLTEMAFAGDVLAIGEPDASDVGFLTGIVYVHVRDPSTGVWSYIARLYGSDTAERDEFGSALGVSDGTIVVGSWKDGPWTGAAFVFEPTVVDPVVEFSGACPGEGTTTVSGLTPLGRQVLYRADGLGLSNPQWRCPDTRLGLFDPWRLADIRADAEGTVVGTEELAGDACGSLLQVIDLSSCAASEVEPVP